MDTLHWVKCQGDAWCSLEGLKLDSVNAEGVYLIWHAGEKPRVLRLGQGNIADRLGVHRADSQILAYKKYGDLMVTWASVQKSQRDGVERHLANTWNPLVGETFPDVQPIAVNSPFD